MSYASNRPLSPHLQVYRWQLTMVLSIFHRATGVALSVGSIGLAVWLVAAAMGGGAFEAVNGVYASWYGMVLMGLWSYALLYHLCNGIRHLIWDTGHGLEIGTSYILGYTVIFVSLLLTLLVWLVALA